MLRIQIPDNNIPEREYVLKVILLDILGLKYSLITHVSESNYFLKFEDCELIIKDSFFSRYSKDLSYLCTNALPERVFYSKNEFTTEKDIPVIFGTDEILVTANKIICGNDIFASIFFMLTRWEEYINKIRDCHDRFPGISSIAYKNSFLNRPVVNEYIEMLWKMMQKLGYKGNRKLRNFELILTHDVDALSSKSSYKTIFGDILKRRDLKIAKENFKSLFAADLYDTFNFLMSASERIGTKSHFYFMSSDCDLSYDSRYYLKRRLFKSTIIEIKKRGHIIGFHPGYYTFDNFERWSAEKEKLEEIIQQELLEGRQHYLRLDVTKTFSIWDKNNMKIDSTLCYADREGFRCGTGDKFPIYDILQRKQLNVNECPLILMDGTLLQYQKYTHDQAMQIFQFYISIGKRYNTNITILFHNSSFFGEWDGYDSLYKRILEMKA